jgi:hypothetical protein
MGHRHRPLAFMRELRRCQDDTGRSAVIVDHCSCGAFRNTFASQDGAIVGRQSWCMLDVARQLGVLAVRAAKRARRKRRG